MQHPTRVWTRAILVLALMSAALIAGHQPAQAAPLNGPNCGQFWPSHGSLQTSNWPDTNKYWSRFEFSLTPEELNALRCAGPYLELEFHLGNFSVPAEWENYSVHATNLPGGMHDVAFMDPANDPSPAVTRIYTNQLQAGVTYYATLTWSANALPGTVPYIYYRWTPSYWSRWNDVVEAASCTNGGNNVFAQGSFFNENEAWCIFPYGNLATTLFGNVAFAGGVPNGRLPLDGFRWYNWAPTGSTAGASTTAPPGTAPAQPPSAPQLPPPPPPVPWWFENLDGDPGSIGHQDYDLGRQPALIQFGTSIHTFYHDASNGKLRHAWADGGGWSFEILDGAGGSGGRISANLGGTPAAVVHNGLLHVFYRDFTNGGLRHGWSTNGTVWSFEHLDGAASAIAGHSNANVGVTPNAVVTPDGRLQLFYYDQTNGNLRHAWLNSTGWHFENLEGDVGSISHYNANIGTDPTSAVYNGILHLFYRDITTGNLRHAWDNSTGWHFENLDGDPGSIAHLDGDIGHNPAAVVYNGTLQLFYYDSTRGNLRHAWDNGTTGWQFENLEGSPSSVSGHDSNVGLMPAVTVLGNTLQAFYYESSSGNLRHAHADATGWHFENLDGAGGSPSTRYNANIGWDPAAIAYNGRVQLMYFDVTNGNLRHAWSQ